MMVAIVRMEVRVRQYQLAGHIVLGDSDMVPVELLVTYKYRVEGLHISNQGRGSVVQRMEIYGNVVVRSSSVPRLFLKKLPATATTVIRTKHSTKHSMQSPRARVVTSRIRGGVGRHMVLYAA